MLRGRPGALPQIAKLLEMIFDATQRLDAAVRPTDARSASWTPRGKLVPMIACTLGQDGYKWTSLLPADRRRVRVDYLNRAAQLS
jgi:hypothetical protein